MIAPSPETGRSGRSLPAFFASDPLHSNRPLDLLTVTAVAYVALPNLVFVLGWLKLPVGAMLAVATLVALAQLFRHAKPGWRPGIAPLLLLAIAASWCVFGGAGHFTYANTDWHVRDAVYGDLIHSRWPPAYAADGDTALVLRSAFGYFLVPALIVSRLGIQAADAVLFAWTALGVAIFLSLLPLSGDRLWKRLLLVTVIIAFSGMDIAGILLTTGEWPTFPLRLEWWTSFSYTSISGQLFWAPNHSLPMWLGAALFFRHWAHPDGLRLAVVFAPLTLIWTPFAAVALSPFFLICLASNLMRGHVAYPTLVQWLWGLALGALVAKFLTLDIGAIPTKTGVAHAGGSENFWKAYLVFAIIEFGALALLLAARLKHSHGTFGVAVAVLLALPFAFFGPSNDLLLRVSTPALVVLMILTLSVMRDALAAPSPRTFPWALLAVLVIGACTPFNEIWRAATWRAWQPNYRLTLIDVEEGGLPPHYIGRLDGTGISQLVKPVEIIPTRAARELREGPKAR